MSLRSRLILVLAIALGGCASAPQLPIPVAKDLGAQPGTRIGVAATALPRPDTQFPGASCLLCLATANIANQSLTYQVQTWPVDDLATLKDDVAAALRAKGAQVQVLPDALDLKKLPSLNKSEPNFAKLDFSALKARHNIDRLVVIDITALGAWRNYSAYIATSDPKAVVKGLGYIVNLDDNRLEWYLPVDIQKSADQKWDEPPKFPGLTNAFFQALEMGKDAFVKPFSP